MTPTYQTSKHVALARKWGVFALALVLISSVAAECPMDGSMGGGGGDGMGGGGDGMGGGGGDTSSAIVKTQMTLGSAGKIAVGDNLVVFGVGSDEAAVTSNQEAGVHYFNPADVDNTTTSVDTVPNSGTLFGTRDFAVALAKIALTRSTGAVSIFNTETETLVDIAITDIAVEQMGGANEPGQMRANGQYIATINNENTVTDGNVVKVIDVSGANPSIISFPNPDDALGDPEVNFDQLDIDATTMQVAAISDHDIIYIFDINNPNAAPMEIDLGLNSGTDGFRGAQQMVFRNGKILYHEAPSPSNTLPGNGDVHTAILDVDSGDITTFTASPTTANTPLAMSDTTAMFFVWREDADMGDENNSYRSAIGPVADAPDATLASQTDRYDFRTTQVSLASAGGETTFSQDDCLDQKLIGYGATCAVTPDGSRYFLGGWGPIDRNFDYIQMSTGGAFTDFEDPEGDTVSGALMGSDITCNDDVAAFRGLREEPSAGCITDAVWVVSIIKIDEL